MFKLSQGEYVRPEYIEGVYKGTPQLANVFVHGDSQENFLVAVVYPDPDALKAFCAAEGVKGATLAEQAADPRVEHWLFQLMQETAVREKVREHRHNRRMQGRGWEGRAERKQHDEQDSHRPVSLLLV
jgi:long-chain acyl-CoA synthetase